MNIGYQTRKYGNDAVRISGGSFGGSIDIETVNRLVNCSFEVRIKPSGSPVFVDTSGRPVRLYIHVDPDMTTKGIAAIRAHRLQREVDEARAQETREQEERELADAMASLTHAEIIERLKRSMNHGAN